MLARLPGWVVDDVASVREEVADLIGAPPERLWRLALACGRDVTWALRAGGRAERVLEARDPLPPSTIAALARLRVRAGWGRAGR